MALSSILLGQSHHFHPYAAQIAQSSKAHLRPSQILVVRIGVADQDNVLGAMKLLDKEQCSLLILHDVDGYDLMRAGGMKQAIYKLSLFFDDRLFYECAFDTVDYSTGNDVFFEYDFAEAAKEHSKCPSSQQGGHLGEFSPGQIPASD